MTSEHSNTDALLNPETRLELVNRRNIKVVRVGIQFDRIGEIDTMNEKFYAELTIEAQWQDDNVKNVYNPEIHWNPNLYIENTINEPKEMIKYSVENNGTSSIITQRRVVKGSFWERIELQNFPIDVQALSITVTSSKGFDELKIIQNNKKLFFNSRLAKTFIDQQKWRLFKLVDIAETASYDIETLSHNSSIPEIKVMDQPKICATCYVSRQPHYYLWNAFFLIFLITVCSLNTFAIDRKQPHGRLIPSFTLLLTSISFKWVTNRSLPLVAYLTSLDKYAIANILFLCLVSCWHAIVGSFWTPSYADDVDRWLLLAFGVSLGLINFAFFLWFIYAYRDVIKLNKRERVYLKNIVDSANEMGKFSKKILIKA